jgi:hypothetical protein
MLAHSTVLEIERLLKQGKLSHRAIAARLGVGRTSVGAIATGSRHLYGKGTPDENRSLRIAGALPQRCPHCGHRVYLPCLVCSTRHFQQVRKATKVLTARARRQHEPRRVLRRP